MCGFDVKAGRCYVSKTGDWRFVLERYRTSGMEVVRGVSRAATDPWDMPSRMDPLRWWSRGECWPASFVSPLDVFVALTVSEVEVAFDRAPRSWRLAHPTKKG